MKTNLALKAAVSVALASAAMFAGTAHAAVDPDTLSADNFFRVGGATASDRSLAGGWIKELCNAAGTPAQPNASAGYNVEVFTTNSDFLELGAGASDVTRNYAVSCRMAATANGAAANQDVVMIKFSGGSSTGVTPVASGTPLAATGSANWVDVAACRDANGAPTGGATREEIPASGGLPNLVLYSNCPVAGSQVAKAGLSDLEPGLIVTGGASLALTTVGGASIPMGVAVTKNFFEALQDAQGIGASCDGTMASYTPACTPNLSAAMIAGIYKGSILATTQIEDQLGAAIPAPAGGSSLRVCRRVDGSGTQRSHQVHMLAQGCAASSTQTFVAASASGTYVDGNIARVFAGTGAGDVQNCLDDTHDQLKYGVGTLSLESNNFDDSEQEWRFVKVDGVFPSLENVVRGEYNFFVDSACNRPSAASTNVLSAVQSALASGTVTGSTATGLCGALRGEVRSTNPSGSFEWLLGTLNTPASLAATADPTPATERTTADVVTNPTNMQTRAPTYGGTPNNCNRPWYGQVATAPADDDDQP